MCQNCCRHSDVALAIAAGQSVVSIATLLMTMSFALTMVLLGLLVNPRIIAPRLSRIQ